MGLPLSGGSESASGTDSSRLDELEARVSQLEDDVENLQARAPGSYPVPPPSPGPPPVAKE